MEALFTDPQAWWAFFEIIIVNTLLSGDNAVVIALSCRNLPKAQRRKAVFAGTLIAVALRVVLTLFAGLLLAQPYLKLVGSLLLIWISIKFLVPDSEETEKEEGTNRFWPALRTVVIADAVMSMDNVVGVAAAAKGQPLLLVLGLLTSMPLIIYGSTLIIRLLGRYPVLVTAGAALLGFIAGEMAVSDNAVAHWFDLHFPLSHFIVPVMLAALPLIVGKMLKRRTAPKILAMPIDMHAPPRSRETRH